MTTLPTGQDIAQRVAAGDLDGSLAIILEALQARFSEGAAALKWTIDCEPLGLKMSEDDLTLDEAMLIETMSGCTWAEIDPVRSATHCRAILAACISQRQGLTPEEATEKLKPLKVVELLRSIKREEVNPAPLDSAT